MPRFIKTTLPTALMCAALIGCVEGNAELPDGGPAGPTSDRPDTVEASRKVKITAPLYKPQEYDKAVGPTGELAADPVVIRRGLVTVKYKVEMPAELDSRIMFLGTPIEGMPEGRAANGVDFFKHPKTGKYYKRLAVGTKIEKDQQVVQLDDDKAYARLQELEASLRAAERDAEGAEKLVASTEADLSIKRELYKRRAVPKLEVIRSEAQYNNSIAQAKSKRAQVESVQGQLIFAQTQLNEHKVYSPIPGTITKIYRFTGEGVKASEPMLKIENFDTLRVEGSVAIESAARLKLGQQVVIEPAVRQRPWRQIIAHRRPLTGITYSYGKEPLAVTSGEDRDVRVWAMTGQILKTWRHPAAVRAVACAPEKSAKRRLLTGADDGKGRLFDLKTMKKVADLSETHPGPILACAFSPDGKYCATADDQRNVFVWDAATGKKRYAAPAVHRGPVTDVTFTPQGRLVTASQDKTICVFELGAKAARLDGEPIEDRAGELTTLGVSADGNRVLFDRAKDELQVVNLSDRRTEQVIRDGNDLGQFARLALFSPDGKLVLTASNQDGLLQLWKLPGEWQGRCSEVRRLVCPDGSKPTTAAFLKPVGSRKGQIAVGTDTGRVFLFEMPAEAEVNVKLVGKVTRLAESLQTGGQRVAVWAEFDNNGPARLQPGLTATMVIRPADAE